mgnify:CR=1 FL=1
MKKTIRFAMLIAAAALLLSACIPTTTAPDGATIDATQAAQMIEDAVEKALDAQATENAANQPAATATLPPATVTPIPAPATETAIPTVTAIVIPPTATAVPASGGTYTTPKYYCEFNQGKKPKDNSIFAAGDSFDIKFTIVNKGTATWVAGTDVRYAYNTDLTNGGTSMGELAVDVAPGESVTIGPFDAWAPAKSGHYVMGFVVDGVDNCTPYVAIDVK